MKGYNLKIIFKFYVLNVSLLLFFIGTSCNHITKQNERNMVKVRAIIVDFIPRADHIDFDSGNSTTYDATLLRITAPLELKDNKLFIYRLSVDQVSVEDEKWRNLNKELEFTIEKQFLEKGECFEGVISNINWL